VTKLRSFGAFFWHIYYRQRQNNALLANSRSIAPKPSVERVEKLIFFKGA